jgi:hypothetical protein
MIESLYKPEALATMVADKWSRWDSARNEWKEERKELRQYLFATSTRKTTNKKLPWKNSTVTPKLTQIRDNLHANYMAALFPNDSWFQWESTDKTPDMAMKKRAITAYMRNKLIASGFPIVVSQLVYDYIDNGNVIAGHTFVSNIKEDSEGNRTPVYIGPKAFRVSPYDVVFDPTAEDFNKSPFIRRIVKTLGDLQDDINNKPALGYDMKVFQQCLEMRGQYRNEPDHYKRDGLIVDGFGSLEEYINSDLVEILEYWGDVFDPETTTVHKDMRIAVVDRKWVLCMKPNDSALGKKPFVHCGWRLRPDNLWAQGPLDQLVGMQYRIDHLENLKADVFDQIAHPVTKIMGTTVEEFQFGPGETIFCGDAGNVDFVRPDATALNADFQISELMNRMEEMAGAPKQAMGIRTPGEKTAYEVQQLENAAGRIFQSKIQWFERNVLEPLLNSMLEESVRHFGHMERIKVIDEKFGAEMYVDITKEDLQASGRLYPIGARHFAEKAKFVQELSQTLQVIGIMPEIKTHLSSKAIAKALEDNLGWSSWSIVADHAGIYEAAETERLAMQVQEDLAAENAVDVEQPPMTDEGIDEDFADEAPPPGNF